jgi:hypothetical protein
MDYGWYLLSAAEFCYVPCAVKLGLDAASILVVTDLMVPLDRFLLMKIDAALIYALFSQPY